MYEWYNVSFTQLVDSLLFVKLNNSRNFPKLLKQDFGGLVYKRVDTPRRKLCEIMLLSYNCNLQKA